MKKSDILKKLDELKKELNINKVIIISGASLVLQDVIEETSDIDLSCEKEYYDKINWNEKIGSFGVNIKSKECFDISDNLHYPNDIVLVSGYKCLNIDRCYQIKKRLNRQKDKEILKKIEELKKTIK